MYKIISINENFKSVFGLIDYDRLPYGHPLKDRVPDYGRNSLEFLAEYRYTAYGDVDILFANAMWGNSADEMAPLDVEMCGELADCIAFNLAERENYK